MTKVVAKRLTKRNPIYDLNSKFRIRSSPKWHSEEYNGMAKLVIY